MCNFSKRIQRFISWIPIVSTILILILTCKNFSERKVNLKKWFTLFFTIFVIILIVFVCNKYILSGQFPILNVILSISCFIALNLQMIEWQQTEETILIEPKKEETKTSIKKKGLSLTIVAVVCVAMVYCTVVGIFVSRLFPFESEYIDGNGLNNFSLEFLGEKDLADDVNSMYWVSYSHDGNETQIKGHLEDEDRDSCTYQAKIFDGVFTAQATKIEKDALNLKLNSQVKAGNFEIFILIDDEVDQRIQANCEKKIVLEGIKGKTILVKIVGEGADFAFSVERNY